MFHYDHIRMIETVKCIVMYMYEAIMVKNVIASFGWFEH